MKKNKNTKHILAAELLLILFSGLMLAGVLTILGPCSPNDDGSFMTCHTAGVLVTILAAILLVLSVMHLIFRKRKMKWILDLIIVLLSAATMHVPGGFLELCTTDTMRCHTIMKPAVLVFGALIVMTAFADFLFRLGKDY